MNDAVLQLYQEVIVAHHKAPHRYGALPGATHEATLVNPLCGDEITVRAVVAGGRLADVRFEARGCVLSRAAGSLMADAVAGQPLAAVLARGRALEAFVSGPPAPGAAAALGDLAVLEGVRDYPSRVGCVTLPWQALARALGG